MRMLSTSRTGWAHMSVARPEHTTASMAESKRRTPMGSMEFVQEVCSKRGWDDDMILLEK